MPLSLGIVWNDATSTEVSTEVKKRCRDGRSCSNPYCDFDHPKNEEREHNLKVCKDTAIKLTSVEVTNRANALRADDDMALADFLMTEHGKKVTVGQFRDTIAHEGLLGGIGREVINRVERDNTRQQIKEERKEERTDSIITALTSRRRQQQQRSESPTKLTSILTELGVVSSSSRSRSRPRGRRATRDPF